MSHAHQCLCCGQKFSSRHFFFKHLRHKEQQNNDSAFIPCECCGQEFVDAEKWDEHVEAKGHQRTAQRESKLPSPSTVKESQAKIDSLIKVRKIFRLFCQPTDMT